METQSFENKDIQYAYISIHEFFSGFGLCGAIDYMESILHDAAIEKVWSKAAPYESIYFIDHMQQLCSAAFVIFNNRAQKNPAMVRPSGTDDTEMPEMKFPGHKYSIAHLWNNFPRNLTLRQYYNPYKAIKKFCSYLKESQWKKVLEECVEYALGSYSIQEALPSYDILIIRLRLLQLIEACHLIDVRINTEIDNCLNEKTNANNIVTE